MLQIFFLNSWSKYLRKMLESQLLQILMLVFVYFLQEVANFLKTNCVVCDSYHKACLSMWRKNYLVASPWCHVPLSAILIFTSLSRSVYGKTMPEVSSRAQGRRAVLKISPERTDQNWWITCLFFFLKRCAGWEPLLKAGLRYLLSKMKYQAIPQWSVDSVDNI